MSKCICYFVSKNKSPGCARMMHKSIKIFLCVIHDAKNGKKRMNNRIIALRLITFVVLQTECPREHAIHSSTEVCSRGGEHFLYSVI